MLILESLIQNARQAAGDEALVELDLSEVPGRERRALTWRQFDEAANALAHYLAGRGLGRGDKVAILMYNSLAWLPVYFGVLKAGCIAVPLNFRLSPEEIGYCLRRSDAAMLLYGGEFRERLAGVDEGLRNVLRFVRVGEPGTDGAESYDPLSGGGDVSPVRELPRPDDEAAIYFSSGTTGFPKAIVHTHRNLAQAGIVEQKHHSQTRDDVFLCIPPLYHTGAIMHWFGSLLTAGRAVLLRGASPGQILSAVSRERCTIVWLLVPWAQDILTALENGMLRPEDYHLSQWRLMHIGAQPVPPSLIRRWLQRFPWQQYDTNYGLSESCGPGCVHLGVENVDKVGAIGVPGYGWQCRIVDAEGRELPSGQRGELCVRGIGVMKGYYGDEAATAETLRAGWLFTGDIAVRDADGFYYLVDRKKDVIISGGENIYPVEIENFLRTHDAVGDAAVIGYPDARLGESVCAVVEVKAGRRLDEKELLAYCAALPRYKRPRRIILDSVPRNATGKIEKNRLRRQYCGAESACAG